MRFTVFGAGGFIGSRLAAHLRTRGHEVRTPARGEEARGPLGNAVYAIGITADFREKPFETIDAHVSTLARLLQGADYESWLLLSSTRLYGLDHGGAAAREDDAVTVQPGADTLYDLTKLTGEALCLSMPRTRVARLSNVYGVGQARDNFLGSVLGELAAKASVVLREAPESSKDYVAVERLPSLLEAMALRGRERVYNVASGRPVTHASLAARLAELTGREVRFAPNAPRRALARIDASRAAAEFGFDAGSLLDDLPALLAETSISRTDTPAR